MFARKVILGCGAIQRVVEAGQPFLAGGKVLVGLMAEPLPKGFGCSETAFRIFNLMASRRLKSDRFLSKDYTPEVYTKAGFEWVEGTSMIDVLLRHFPKLKPAVAGIESAFHPWKTVKG